MADAANLPDTPSGLPLEPCPGAPIELRLLVWLEHGAGWRARVTGPGLAERDFVSPFELARFVAWPLALPSHARSNGLR